MHHLMLDIETLDIKPSAVILVVAAVFFDPQTGQLGAEFENAVSSQKISPAEPSAWIPSPGGRNSLTKRANWLSAAQKALNAH